MATYKTQNNIILLWYEFKFLKMRQVHISRKEDQENENLEIKS